MLTPLAWAFIRLGRRGVCRYLRKRRRSYQSTFSFLSPSDLWTANNYCNNFKKLKEMKKYLSFMAFAMMAVFSLVFVSCSSDDDDDDVSTISVVGTWEVTYARYTSNFDISNELEVGDIMTFNADGTYRHSKGKGTWKKEDNVLTISSDSAISIPAITTIKTLTESVLEMNLDYGGFCQAELKLKRVE